MPKIVCVNCQTELRIEKQGAYVIEMFNNPPVPYKIWCADVWECPGCKQSVVAGFAQAPLAENYDRDFDEILNSIFADKGARVVFDYEKPFITLADNESKETLQKGGDTE